MKSGGWGVESTRSQWREWGSYKILLGLFHLKNREGEGKSAKKLNSRGRGSPEIPEGGGAQKIFADFPYPYFLNGIALIKINCLKMVIKSCDLSKKGDIHYLLPGVV